MSQNYTVGDTIVEGFPTGSAGESFTIHISRDPNGATFLTYPGSFTEIGTEGDYLVTTTVDTAGNWYARFIGDTSGEEITINWIVGPAATTSPTAAVAGLTNTRKALRQMIARRLPGEQYLALVATDGSTTTFNDTENLQGPNDAYRGGELYVTAGTPANIGKTRRLQSSVQSTGQLNWGTALPAPVVAGDEAELWNLRGIGTRAQQVNDAINDAIVNARKHSWIAVEANVTLAFDQTAPNVVIPVSVTKGIFGLDYQDSQYPDQWHEIDGGGESPRVGWWYDRGAGEIVIGGYWASAADTYTLRVRGYGYPPLLSADTDTTQIDPEWIATEAVRLLLTTNMVKNPDYERWVQGATAEAAAKRAYAVGRKAPNTIILG